jgi:uncharacterized ferritin-like protein (DUF455 family)
VVGSGVLAVPAARLPFLLFPGDPATAGVLERIYRDEIRHVRYGTTHFADVCDKRGIPPAATWKKLVGEHFRGSLKAPFNDSARQSAGLPREFYAGIDL